MASPDDPTLLEEALFDLVYYDRSGKQAVSRGCLSAFLKPERLMAGARDHLDFSYDAFSTFAKNRAGISGTSSWVAVNKPSSWTAILPNKDRTVFFNQQGWDDMLSRLLKSGSGSSSLRVIFMVGALAEERGENFAEGRNMFYGGDRKDPVPGAFGVNYPPQPSGQDNIASTTVQGLRDRLQWSIPAQGEGYRARPAAAEQGSLQVPEILHRLNTSPLVRVDRDENIVETLLSLIDPAHVFRPEPPTTDRPTDKPPGKDEIIDLTKDQEDEEGADDSLGGSIMARLYAINSLPQGQLGRACDFLGITPGLLRQGFILPGTRMKLWPSQAAFLFQYVSRCAGVAPDALDGQILADYTGFGKTIQSFALFAIMRLLMLSQHHFRQHPSSHNPVRSSAAQCPAGNPYGIQCPCVGGSLSQAYINKLTRGPSLAILKPANTDEWIERARQYFLPFVSARANSGTDVGQKRVRFVTLIDNKGSSLRVQPMEGDSGPTIGLSELIKKLQPAELRQLRNDNAPGATNAVLESIRKLPLTTQRIARMRKLGYRVAVVQPNNSSVDDGGDDNNDDQSHFLCLFSSAAFSRADILPKVLAKKFTMQAQGSTKVIKVDVSFPMVICPNLIVYDEFHNVKNSQTHLWTYFRDIRELSGTDGRAVQWCFLSATPVSEGPSDIRSICEVIHNSPKRREAALDQLDNLAQEFMSNTQKGQLTASSEIPLKFVTHFQNLFVARHRRSPVLDGLAMESTVPKIPQENDEIKEVAFPDSALSSLKLIKDKVREYINQGNGVTATSDLAKLNLIPSFRQLYNATIMPGIALAQEKENGAYPSRSDEIFADLSQRSTSKIFRHLRSHDGHQWKTFVINFIQKAYNDRGNNGSERRKHVLIVTETPCLAGHLYAIISGDASVRKNVVVVNIDQKATSAAKNRAPFIGQVGEEALRDNHRIRVVVSTRTLVGEGIDTLTFCSYLIIFGELFAAAGRDQVTGRLLRPSQIFPVHRLTIRSTHATHRLIADRVTNKTNVINALSILNDS